MIMIPHALLYDGYQEIHFCPQTSLEKSSFFFKVMRFLSI